MSHNVWNIPNGMARTIWFSNQNFRVFRVNGKDPRSHCRFGPPDRGRSGYEIIVMYDGNKRE